MGHDLADWKTFESFEAPGRVKTERLRFTVSQEFIDMHFQSNRLTPLFQASAHLYKRLPEINLISIVKTASPTPTLTNLDDAYACYEGIKRPHDDEDNGDSVLVYVLRPAVTIERQVSMACLARAIVPIQKSVLTALVRTKLPIQSVNHAIDGCVTRLEWVSAETEGDNEMLPRNAKMRYRVKHW